MTRTLVAGVDTSTQSCKVRVTDAETGEMVRFGQAKHPNGTSIDPKFWWDAFLEAAQQAGGLDDVEALAVGGQQHGMVILDQQGNVIRDAMLWNDISSAPQAAALIEKMGEAPAEEGEPEDVIARGKQRWVKAVGSSPVASFTLTKVAWVAENEPENAKKIAAICLPHDWLSWRIAGYGPVAEGEDAHLEALFTDRSDASGTIYYDAASNEYRRDLIAMVLEPAEGTEAAREHANAIMLPTVLGPHDAAAVKASPEIAGKKLGIIGLGAIGILVANAAKSLGMEVYGYDPFLSVDAAWGLSRAIHHATSLDQIYAECDYITVHVPLTPDTREMFNAQAFAAMKPGVRVLNFSRAELVNAADMKAALADGKVAAYVVDFPTEDMLDVENVIAIPHLGASTPESEDNCAVMAADELMDYLENGNITHSVNYPEVSVPRSTETRVCVLHRNIPNMLTGISGVVSSEGINIETMTNRSKKDYAYTILDVVGDLSESSLDKIRAIDGVIRLRKI